MESPWLKVGVINLITFTDHDLGLLSPLHFKICKLVYLIMMFTILRRVSMKVIGHLVLKVAVILATSLKYNIIFAKFLEKIWTAT